MQDQDQEAFGRFLIETIADIYDCEPIPSILAHCVYKHTPSGSYVRFDEEGIIVGTIVERGDAEHNVRIDLTGIDIGADGAALLRKRFYDALDECEEFVDEVHCLSLIDDDELMYYD
jgi:hypothetical protein